MTKTVDLKHPETEDLDDALGGTGDLRRDAEDLPGTRITTVLAMEALRDLLTPRQLDRIARRSATVMVVRVPGPEWCDPVERALDQAASFGWICNRRGASADLPGVGNETVADLLSCGLNVAGVSQDPPRYLPSALVTGADIAVEIGAPSDRAVRAAIAVATGRECRRLCPGAAAGLTLSEIAVAIRPGSTPAQCRRRLAATAAAKAALEPGRPNPVQPPTAPALAGILRRHLGEDLRDVDLLPLATLAAGSTAAQAAEWVRTARVAARAAGRPMRLADLLDLVAGPDARSLEDRLSDARREAAHAAALLAFGVAEVDYVAIVPRCGSAARMGSRLLRPDARTREDVENHVAAVLAGRAADENWGKPTTGSSGGDGSALATATSLLATMHAAWCLGGTLIHRASSAEQAVDLVRTDPGLRATVENALQGLLVRAQVFVRVNSSAIDRLAHLIVADGVVGGDTVRDVLAGPGGARAAAKDAPDAPGGLADRAASSTGTT